MDTRANMFTLANTHLCIHAFSQQVYSVLACLINPKLIVKLELDELKDIMVEFGYDLPDAEVREMFAEVSDTPCSVSDTPCSACLIQRLHDAHHDMNPNSRGHQADTDHSGAISFEEFKKLMLNKE